MDGHQQELSERMRHLITAVESQLAESESETIHSLIRAGEWGVALEILCTQLEERDVHVPYLTYSEIAVLGRMLNLDQSYWIDLRSIE